MDMFPDAFHDIARKVSADHPNDVTAAAVAWREEAKQLPEFADFVDAMLLRFGRELIHDVRHAENKAIRKAAGEYGTPAKVIAGKAVADVAMSCYLYNIAGRTLGSILGGELPGIRDSELQKANGSLFNVALCDELVPLVKGEKSVRDSVPEKKLRKIVDRIKEREAYKVDGKAGNDVNPKIELPSPSSSGRTKKTVPTDTRMSGRETKPSHAMAGN